MTRKKNIDCQEWDSNPCPFGPVPETGALDQLGHLDVDVVKFNNLFIFYGYILYTKAKPKNGTKSIHNNSAIMLYCYILTPQTPKACYSSGAKSKNFSSIATMHIYR